MENNQVIDESTIDFIIELMSAVSDVEPPEGAVYYITEDDHEEGGDYYCHKCIIEVVEERKKEQQRIKSLYSKILKNYTKYKNIKRAQVIAEKRRRCISELYDSDKYSDVVISWGCDDFCDGLEYCQECGHLLIADYLWDGDYEQEIEHHLHFLKDNFKLSPCNAAIFSSMFDIGCLDDGTNPAEDERTIKIAKQIMVYCLAVQLKKIQYKT